jgi:uncharacterized protein (UPF0333 family)
MDVKGQVSVEFLFLVLIIIIIIGTVTIPLIGNAIDSSFAVSDTSDVSAAVNSIANAVGIVYSNGPGSKRTVNVYFPASSTLQVSGQTLQMPVNYANNTAVKVNGTQKVINSNLPYSNLNIQNPSVSKGNYKVTVEWLNNNPNIKITLTPT